MANLDQRNDSRKFPVVKVECPVITLPNAAAAEVKVTQPVNMTIRTIVVRFGNATNGITGTLAIDDSNGAERVSVAAIAENANTVLNARKAAEDFPECPVNGTITIGILPSGDPGAGGVNVYVDLYGV